MTRGFPGGGIARHLAAHGETCTFLNESISADYSTDWDDETVTTEQVTAPALVESTTTAQTVTDAEGTEVDADATVYVAALGAFTPDDGAEPTIVTDASGNEWTVLLAEKTRNGVHELTVNRR